MTLSSRLLSLLAVLLLGACALSPQTVSVRPSVDMGPAVNVGNGQSIALTVRDQRDTTVVGTRGGVYSTTSEIHTQDNITAPIRDELARRLREQGFQIVETGQDTDAELAVIVDSIDYQASGQPVVRSVETAATVRVQARVDNREYSGRYRGTRTTDVLTAPDAEANEEMINAAIARVLERLLKDQELQEFLRG